MNTFHNSCPQSADSKLPFFTLPVPPHPSSSHSLAIGSHCVSTYGGYFAPYLFRFGRSAVGGEERSGGERVSAKPSCSLTPKGR